MLTLRSSTIKYNPGGIALLPHANCISKILIADVIY